MYRQWKNKWISNCREKRSEWKIFIETKRLWSTPPPSPTPQKEIMVRPLTQLATFNQMIHSCHPVHTGRRKSVPKDDQRWTTLINWIIMQLTYRNIKRLVFIGCINGLHLCKMIKFQKCGQPSIWWYFTTLWVASYYSAHYKDETEDSMKFILYHSVWDGKIKFLLTFDELL